MRRTFTAALALLFAILGFSALSPSAHALSFSLTEQGCSGGCGTGPYGSVELLQGVDANTVNITVTLNAPSKFVSTGGPHHALAFSIVGNPAVTIASLPTGFEVGPAPASASPFGSFGYSVDCPGCGPGASNAKPGPLTLTVSSAAGLTPADFIGNAGGYFFAADIIGPSGNTGNVAALIPEPTTALLLTSGLLGISAAAKRRRS